MRRILFSALVLSIAAGGCVSWFLKGAAPVNARYQPNVLIEYKSEGPAPAGATYLLVQTERGEAMFERSADGSGAVISHRWHDKDGDHFACWVPNRQAWVYDVPTDRSQPATRTVYPAGMYILTKIPDVGLWPFATTEIEPQTILHPK